MTTPDHPDTAVVYLINAQSSSAGTGPGPRELPWDEAKSFVDQSFAVWGDRPPMGLYGSPGSSHPGTS